MLNSSVWQYLNVHVNGCCRPQCIKPLVNKLQMCIHPGLSGLPVTQHVNEPSGRIFEPPLRRVGGKNTSVHTSGQTRSSARFVGGEDETTTTPTILTVLCVPVRIIAGRA